MRGAVPVLAGQHAEAGLRRIVPEPAGVVPHAG